MRRWVVLSGISVLTISGLMILRANDDPAQSDAAQYAVSHPECSYFGSDHDKVTKAALKGVGRSLNNHPLSDLTTQVMRAVILKRSSCPHAGQRMPSRQFMLVILSSRLVVDDKAQFGELAFQFLHFGVEGWVHAGFIQGVELADEVREVIGTGIVERGHKESFLNDVI